MDHGYDTLVETLWKDLDGQVTRHQITEVVSEVAARFEKATVPAYVPIFVRRQVLERLKPASSSTSNPVNGTATAADGE